MQTSLWNAQHVIYRFLFSGPFCPSLHIYHCLPDRSSALLSWLVCHLSVLSTTKEYLFKPPLPFHMLLPLNNDICLCSHKYCISSFPLYYVSCSKMIKMALVHFKMKIIILLLESCVREEIKAFGCFCPLLGLSKQKNFVYVCIYKNPHPQSQNLQCHFSPNHTAPSLKLNFQLWV